MHGRDLLARLRRGDHLLLDGATGSELQRRGLNVSKGASVEGGLGAWSATAMQDAPEVVRAIHEDYLRVGADVITANSYNASRGQLGRVGLADKMEEFSRRAMELAREARGRDPLDVPAPRRHLDHAAEAPRRLPRTSRRLRERRLPAAGGRARPVSRAAVPRHRHR